MFSFFCPFFPMSLRQDIPSALFPAFALIAFIISHLTTAFSDLLVSLLCWTKWKVAGWGSLLSAISFVVFFVSFVSRISFVYLLWLIPLLASTPYSWCAIFCPQDIMAWRFANTGVILHWFLLYFFFFALGRIWNVIVNLVWLFTLTLFLIACTLEFVRVCVHN